MKGVKDEGQGHSSVQQVSCSTSYKILEGVWAVCHKPIPPVGAVIAHIQDVKVQCPNIESWFTSLYKGDGDKMVHTALAMIDWVLVELR